MEQKMFHTEKEKVVLMKTQETILHLLFHTGLAKNSLKRFQDQNPKLFSSSFPIKHES